MPRVSLTAVAHRIATLAALVAPRSHRADFRSEWAAEIAWAAGELARGQRTLRHRDVVLRSLGAFTHALWLRKEQWSFDMLWQDLKYGVRVLLGRPSFTLVAVLTLALGIGANTAIFSIVHRVLLKPLPFRDAGRLVQIWETNPLRNWTDATASPANLIDWRRRNNVFEDMAFYLGLEDRTPMYLNRTLTRGPAEPERLRSLAVSANFFRVLGIAPMLGREFIPSDEVPGQNRVAILSHVAWLTHFHADPNVVGRDVELNAQTFRIVGIAPASFAFPRPTSTCTHHSRCSRASSVCAARIIFGRSRG